MNLLNQENAAATIRFVYENETDITDFEGKASSITVRYENDKPVVYVGLGKNKEDLFLFADAATEAVRRVKRLKKASVEICLPQSVQRYAEIAVGAAVMADYAFDGYLSEKPVKIEDLYLRDRENTFDWNKLHETKTVAEAVNYARDLSNENAAVVTPEYLAQEARNIAAMCDNISLEILDDREIREKGLNLLWAVGKGSATPPRLVIASYRGDEEGGGACAFVGKGLTFDSGGLNLKRSGSIETMKHDMSGAASVLGVLRAAAVLKPKVNFIAAIPAAQSAIGKDAFFVGDVYRSYSGKTVEVLNTDAEGRLILADAFEYLIANYKPAKIINLATLTGAIVMALGDTIAGMFTNSDELAQRIFESGERTGERLWRMPIRQEHREAIKSEIADVLNTSTMKRSASSITAAAFLEKFAADIPWCHIDIAGTSWNDGSAKGIRPKYATGFGVRLLWDYIIPG